MSRRLERHVAFAHRPDRVEGPRTDLPSEETAPEVQFPHYRAHRRVIELDRDGRVTGLSVSQRLQDDLDLPQPLLDDDYPALCRLHSVLGRERFANRFRLAAGTCAVFDNHRVVHRREAFEASGGVRHLRGRYVDRGALRSACRTLDRRGVHVAR